ncbi:NAD-dependent epimerase/dehydratase family protein [Paucibacter sp. APW11]|uniref:NAD-dependent epimerase/dehydratase family protein n=2 Tax=Roseateles aquae TaxID=3077235 RepID=A0ABU3P9E3_9BURK|nr:NAD-dependent epimerase/dehydratase family protein [Paucibacter sp. APW11]MDT8998902.1 NAD-dependent epimerase/dehydratase family protein [Paucibacter sp. APW11]
MRHARSNSPKRALRLLIVGCGDVGMRVLRLLAGRWTVYALSSNPARSAELRDAGAIPLIGNLDRPQDLARLAGLADLVLHLAPPPGQGEVDRRSLNLIRALARSGKPHRLVYASTTGVYGDCGGAAFDETRPVRAATARAQRRVDAEQRLRLFGRQHGVAVTVLRIPGIYAWDREGGHPRERLARGAPVLCRDDDVYTNHIHADDLARACLLALLRGAPQRLLHVCDDADLLMGDYFDLAADLLQQPRPLRISRAEAITQMSPMQLSFMSESRRLSNRRLRTELRLKLRYPTPAEGLLAGRS